MIPGHSVSRVLFDDNSNYLCVAAYDGIVRFAVPELYPTKGFDGAGYTGDIATLRDGRMVSAHGHGHDPGEASLWNVDGTRSRWTKTRDAVISVAVRSHDNTIAIRTNDGGVWMTEPNAWT